MFGLFGGARGLECQLRARFDGRLAKPERYRDAAPQECAGYPEGDLLPFVFPVFGYTNDAIANPARASGARAKVEKLLEFGLDSVVRRVGPPGGRLENLAGYQRQAVYLGHIGLALGCYRLIGGDERFDAVHARIADVLHEGLVGEGGRHLWSFPEVTWGFDTMPCLLALRLYDASRGSTRSSEAIRRHLEWVRTQASDPTLRLPYSHLPEKGAGEPRPPRGCDLAYRTWLVAQLDPRYAKDIYEQFRRCFWIERGYLAGFAEWPHGANLGEDVDSGPIVLGMGLAATGFGIGAARCMGDRWRLWRLLGELSAARALFALMRPWTKGRYEFDARYLTGTLMGDAALFATVGWREWGVALD